MLCLSDWNVNTQNRVHALSQTAGAVIGNQLIAPNSLMEFVNVFAQLHALHSEPFLQQLPAEMLPLGRHYVIADKKQKTTAVAAPCPLPQAPFAGRGLFL